MSEDNALVLVAGYQDLDSARHDFQTLVDAAKDKSIPLQGAVLIGKDAEGIQLHGGIAITWEHDMHLYFKRAHGSAQLLESPREVLRRLESEVWESP